MDGKFVHNIGANRSQTDLENMVYNIMVAHHDSLVIVLDTLEICPSSQPNYTAKYAEAMQVKVLLREVCQFIGECSLTSSY